MKYIKYVRTLSALSIIGATLFAPNCASANATGQQAREARNNE